MTDAPTLPGIEAPAAAPPAEAPAPVAAEAAAPVQPSDGASGAADPSPAAPASPEPKPAEAPAAAPTEAAPAAEAAPSAEAKPEGEVKPEAEKPEVKAPRAYTEFKFPEGIKADPAQVSAYTNILGKYDISQEAGQELVDFHQNAMKAYADQVSQHQQDVFAQTQRDWVRDFDKTAGNRRDTVLNDAKWVVTELVSNKKDREALWNVLAYTGAGNNKHVIYLLSAAAKRLRERGAPGPGLPLNGARSGTPADRRYGKTA